MKILLFILILPSLALTGCQSAINKAVKETKYSAYEFVGIEKRDLFKREVKNVKGSQEDTKESFKDALERLQDIYGTNNSHLERQYSSLDSAYEDAQKRVNEVRINIKKLETVAEDLFSEWKKEITEMSAASLRSKSADSLEATRRKYDNFHNGLKKSGVRMDPVLRKLRDQVLFLKHNLNAKAIAGLKIESEKIQNDIEGLLKDMKISIEQADDFIKTM